MCLRQALESLAEKVKLAAKPQAVPRFRKCLCSRACGPSFHGRCGHQKSMLTCVSTRHAVSPVPGIVSVEPDVHLSKQAVIKSRPTGTQHSAARATVASAHKAKLNKKCGCCDNSGGDSPSPAEQT